MHGIDDGGSAADEVDLVVALDGALPVDQPGRVEERGICEVPAQRCVGGGREPVIVHLDADARRTPAARRDDLRKLVHRMAFRILHIAVLVAHDIVVAHEDRALGALGIHAAAPPDGLALEAQQHGLMHVEAPAVIAGEPGHVGRVRDDDEVDPPFRHGGPCLRDAAIIFGAGKVQRGLGHGNSLFSGTV